MALAEPVAHNIVRLDPCPKKSSGQGRLVTSVYRHYASNVIGVQIKSVGKTKRSCLQNQSRRRTRVLCRIEWALVHNTGEGMIACLPVNGLTEPWRRGGIVDGIGNPFFY